MRGRPIRGWRKIAGSYWGPPSDPQFYGDLDVDAQAMLDFAAETRRITGVPVTMTHLVVRAIAHALAAEPTLNGSLHRSRFLPRDSVDVFVIATTDEGRELTGVKIEGADRKSAVETAGELRRRLAVIAAGEDPEFAQTKQLLEKMPPRMLRWSMRLAAWLAIDRDLDLRKFGLPSRQTFGSAMVTSVGMFGVERAYSPLSRFYRVPFLILVGKVSSRPVAIEGRVVIRPILPLTGTIDHRYLDGFQAARLAALIREYCHDPAAFEPPLAAPARADGATADRAFVDKDHVDTVPQQRLVSG